MILVFQAILKSTPTFYLFEDLLNSVVEFQLWLRGNIPIPLLKINPPYFLSVEIVLSDHDRSCIEKAMITLNILSKLAKSSEEVGLNQVESTFLSSSTSLPSESSNSEKSAQSVATLDLNSTIRMIKQTSLK